MSEPPPPWARPDPATPPPREAPATRPEAKPEPELEPEPELPPLFPTEAPTGDPMLFPGGADRPRVPEHPPEAPPAARRVRSDEPHPAGERAGGPPPGRRPPPMPAGKPQYAAAPPADPHVGVVAGPVGETRAKRSYPGFAVLIVAAVLAVAAVLGRALIGDASFALAIVPPLLAAVMWLALRLTRGSGELSVPVRRFRLQPADGRTGHFLIEGEIAPGSLEPGILVRVHGRGERDGHTVARQVDVLATLSGPVVRQVSGRPSRAVAAARLLSGICLVLAGILLVAAAVVVAG